MLSQHVLPLIRGAAEGGGGAGAEELENATRATSKAERARSR